MTITNISNQQLQVEINTLGAELQSLKKMVLSIYGKGMQPFGEDKHQCYSR